MLKDQDSFDNNLNNCEVHDAGGVARPGTVGRDRSPGRFAVRRLRACRISGRQGVNPEPPDGSGPASTLPFKRGTRTTGVSGSSA